MPERAANTNHSFDDGRDPEPVSPDDIRLQVDKEIMRRLEAAIADRDFEAATALLREDWFHVMLALGGGLVDALAKIPHASLREHPLLTMALGIAYNTVPHKRAKAFTLFATAAVAARASNHSIGAVDRALILVTESAAFRLIGRARLGKRASRAAIAALDHLSDNERESIGAISRLYAHVGTTLYYAGEVDEALEAFEKGLAEPPENGYSGGFANLAMLAGIHAVRGDIYEAVAHAQSAQDDRWTDMQRSWYPGTFYRIAEAIIALERFDTDAARAHLDAMVHDRRSIEHWLAIAITEAMTELLAGRPGEALSELESFVVMRGSEGRTDAARTMLAPTRVLIQLALGNPDAARVIARRDTDEGIERHIALARVELSLGRHGAALTEIRAVQGSLRSAREVAEAAVIEAAALLRFSASARSEGIIQQLGALVERSGQRVPLVLVPHADRLRIVAALDDAGYNAATTELPQRTILPDADADAILSERELAVLQSLMRNSSAARIAAELVVSVNTVKSQLRSVYRKLGVSNRDQAIAVALDRHLLVQRED
ncbi:MAG: LuxR C-terminal-related transcriptional regulator [Lacisediminihabitans sp.]